MVNVGMLTISTTENREMREFVVVIRFLPFFCIQKIEWSHTLLYFNHSSISYIAGKITTTIDVMRIQEVCPGVFCVFCSLSVERITVFTGFRFPNNEFFIFGFPYLIPDDIDGETVLLFSILIFFLTTEVVCQVYVGIAGNIGRGELLFVNNCFSILICDVTLSTTEYLSGKVSGIDVDIGTALYLCQVASTIDITIDIRSLLYVSFKGYAGVSYNPSY